MYDVPTPPDEILLGRGRRSAIVLVAVLLLAAVAGLVTWRASTGGAPHGHTSAAPTLPPAQGDVAEAIDTAQPSDLHTAPRGAVIGSNNIKIKLDESGPVNEFVRNGVRQGPPLGQQLLGFQLEFDGGENNFARLSELELGVSVAGAPPRHLKLDQDTDEGGQLFVVGVPTRTAPVDLVLTDSGLSQRLDLRTGRPGAQNVSFLRTGQRYVYGTAEGVTTALVGGQPVQVQVSLSDAQLYFFVPPAYAHPLRPSDVFLAPNLCYRFTDATAGEGCHSFRATDVTVTPRGGRPVTGRTVTGTGGATFFEVPAGTTRGTITISGSEAGSGFRMVITRRLALPFDLRQA